MLLDLQIQGLAIIDKLAISFGPGMNVITGETGAGKSILIKALHLLLGSKTTPDVVRKGSPAAMVAGRFSVPNGHTIEALLGEWGLAREPDDGEAQVLLLRRSITAKGRSAAWVNDTPITLASLQRLGRSLVDIFAQHDNQRLLDETKHVHYLDAFLADPAALSLVQKLYRSAWQAFKDLQTLGASYREQQRSQDYLQFRSKELADFDPTADDYEAVAHFCQGAEVKAQRRDALSKVQQRLDCGADGEALSQALWDAVRLLEKAPWEGDDLNQLIQETRDTAARLDDLGYTVGRLVDGLEFSEGEWEDAQARLADYQRLFRKFAVEGIAGLVDEQAKLEASLRFLDQALHEASQILLHLSKLTRELGQAAKVLSEQRRKAVASLRSKVRQEFEDLAMPQAQLDVELEAYEQPLPDFDLSQFSPEFAQSHGAAWQESLGVLGRCRENGQEKARFLLTTNPGEPLRPLSRVASGGEVSRIMLALKKALVAEANTCLLVFDEIDTGISGRVADRVGRKIKELARGLQVICISHLPQVAAYADSHLSVRKAGSAQRTGVSILHLDAEESVHEIARLLSGENVTEVSLEHARSLRDKRQQALQANVQA